MSHHSRVDGSQSEEELDRAQALHPRAARDKLRLVEDYLAHLHASQCHARDLGIEVDELDSLIDDGHRLRESYADKAGLRIDPRRRPGKERQWSPEDERQQYMMCLDECGTYQSYRVQDNFPVFSICGVIMKRDEFEVVDREWRAWKTRWLGSDDTVFHEPELRRWRRAFFLVPERDRTLVLASLDQLLSELDFTVIAAVIDKKEMLSRFPADIVNEFLPQNYYLMALDFIFERFTHFLFHRGGDGWGRVFAESRGRHEDPRAQFEYVRLQNEGTAFSADRTFQYHLDSAITFIPKHENHSGLQIADLLARACAEKALNPSATPARWHILEEKLYDGCKGEPEKYGLKLFPAHAREVIFGQAKGGVGTPPFAD